ncbi:MAG: hypothetical protein ACR2FU_12815, partial [Streptosporangiaceae bacterium]
MSDPSPGPVARQGPRGRATVARPRVTALLAAARQRRATLVIAGAGYGKTTALAEVAAAGASAWVRLRPGEGPDEATVSRGAITPRQPPENE